MTSPSSASGGSDYRPPRHQPSPFQQYCASCPGATICGERSTAGACDDPAAYRLKTAHPALLPLRSNELQLPPSGRQWGSVSIDGCTIPITSSPTPSLRTFGTDLRTALDRAGPGTERNAIAFLLGRDSDLERVWTQRGSLGRHLRAKGYTAAIAPAFSTWHDDPPFSGLLSVARSAAVADALASALPTVPTLVWRTAVDIHRQIEWLSRGKVLEVAIDLSTRRPIHWDWLLAGVERTAERFIEVTGRVPILLAHGPSTRTRIEQVSVTWPGRVIFASHLPYHVAQGGCRLKPELGREFDASLTHRQLVVTNAAAFEAAVARSLGRRPSSGAMTA